MNYIDPGCHAVHITKIDRKNNTVHFMLDGIHVTAICAEEEDEEVMDNVKSILIGNYLANQHKSGRVGII